MAAFRNNFLISIPKIIFYQNLRPKSGLKLPMPLIRVFDGGRLWVLNVTPTAEVMYRLDLGFKSQMKDWSSASNS